MCEQNNVFFFTDFLYSTLPIHLLFIECVMTYITSACLNRLRVRYLKKFPKFSKSMKFEQISVYDVLQCIGLLTKNVVMMIEIIKGLLTHPLPVCT